MFRPLVSLLAAASAGVLLASCVQAPSKDNPVAVASKASPAEQFIGTVQRTVLPNGLTVLIRQQKGTGIVAINTYVKAGYFHEPDSVAGMAHLFEHMFFKGSRAYPGPEAIAQAITGAGGRLNAGTIYDKTSYYTVLPREGLVRGIEVQADAIAHPLFDPVELKKEAEVVIEESNRKFDNAGAVALERMWATSYTQHRMKRWRIGSNEVLRNINRTNLIAFFETLYRPENIIVTVAGDMDPAEALATVKRTFGEIPRGTLKKERGPKEPAQTAFRFGRSEGDIKEGHSVFGWQTVPERHADEIALEVLAGVLGQGRSSRFYRGAVSPTAASTAAAFHLTFEDVGIFSVSSTHPEANRAEVERRVIAEIERMKQFGPTEYELAQAKNAAQVGFVGQIDTALEQAEALSEFESRGSYRDLAKKFASLEAITATQVRDAARRYLTTEKLTLYHYQPKGAAAVTEAAALERIRTAAATTGAAPVAVALPDLRNTVEPARGDTALQTFTLSNGATLVVQQRSGVPVVASGIYFRGGRSQETPANAGITRLMQAAMKGGTATRSGEEIDREIEFLGTQVAAETSEDGFGFSFKTLNRFYEPALAVLVDVVMHPGFPQDGITREKSLQVAALRRSLDSAVDRPRQLFRSALFANHPYGLDERGTEATIAAIDRGALEAWWKASVVADRAMVIVVGDVDAEQVRRTMETRLAGMQRSAVPLKALPPVELLRAPKELVEQRERKQTAMIIGFPAAAPASPDWPAMRLLQAHTSGLSGTFFRQLRSREQLAYTVQAAPISLAQQGAFIGYLAGEATKENQARASLLRELRKLQGEGIDPAEMERAKVYLAGNVRIGRETNEALMREYGRDFQLGTPLGSNDATMKRMAELSADDVRAVAKKYFAGDNYVYAAVRGSATAK